MYLILFTHPSVLIHLGFIHVLALVNSAAMNVEGHLSFKIMVFSGSVPRAGIAGSYGTFRFRFWWNFVLFSFVGFLSFIPTNREEGSFPPLPLQHLLLWIFYADLPDVGEVMPHCTSVRSSLILTDAEHAFMCFRAISLSSVEKGPFKSCASIWLRCFFDSEVHKLFVCFREKFLMGIFVCKYSSIWRVVFC